MCDMGRREARAALSNLHAKSLVMADIGAEIVLYWLLERALLCRSKTLPVQIVRQRAHPRDRPCISWRHAF